MKKTIVNKLIISHITITFLVIIAIILLSLSLTVFPFPERFFIHQMNNIQIQQNQHITLVLIYLSIAILIGGFMSLIVLSTLIYYQLICNQNSFLYKWFNKIENNFLNTSSQILFLFGSYLFFFIYTFIYLFNVLKKNDNYQTNKNKKLKFNLISSLTPICFGFVLIGTAIPILNSSQKNEIYVNKKDIDNFLRLSNNKSNTLMFYFDRGIGSIFNILLLLDYQINQEKSFIYKHKEFTSFIQAFSASNVTAFSNTSLVAGAWYAPEIKNMPLNNPYLSNAKNMNEISFSEFWGQAFYNQANMFKQNDVDNIQIASVPYYSYHESNMENGAEKLNAALKAADVNAYTTTNEAIASLYLNDSSNARITNAKVLNNVVDLTHFENTDKGVYQGWYFHHIHERYSFYENGEYFETDAEIKNFIKSIWFSIQALNDIMDNLKNTPHYNENNEVDGSVYDHSQIVFVADHGLSFPYSSDFESLVNMLEIDDEYKELNFLKYFFNSDINAFNSVFVYKPFKDTFLDQENQHFTFNSSVPIATYDLPLFLEAGLARYNHLQQYGNVNEFSMDNSYFNPITNFDLTPINQKNRFMIELLKNSIVNDPFNKNNWDKLKNRELLLTIAGDWRYTGDKNIINIYKSLNSTFNQLNVYDNPYQLFFKNEYFQDINITQ